MSVAARRHYGCGTGALSIKSFRGGEAVYSVGSGRFRVGDGAFLILNHGQHYETEIDAKQKVESFCVFFRPDLAADAGRRFTADVQTLLDEPYVKTDFDFVERTYRHDRSVTPALMAVKAAHDAGAPNQEIEERLLFLLDRMVSLRFGNTHEAQILSAQRIATRDEVYRRLHRARDFIHACCEHTITLNDSAAVACMSPGHFLRSFKELFACTPYQYLTRERLERGRVLLGTDLSVTQVCFRLGFSSPASFSHLFRRHVGVSPTRYREQMRPSSG